MEKINKKYIGKMTNNLPRLNKYSELEDEYSELEDEYSESEDQYSESEEDSLDFKKQKINSQNYIPRRSLRIFENMAKQPKNYVEMEKASNNTTKNSGISPSKINFSENYSELMQDIKAIQEDLDGKSNNNLCKRKREIKYFEKVSFKTISYDSSKTKNNLKNKKFLYKDDKEWSFEDDEELLKDSQNILEKLKWMKKNLEKPLEKEDKRFIYIDKETGNFKINISIITKAYSKLITGKKDINLKEQISKLFCFFDYHYNKIRILKNQTGNLFNNQINNMYTKEYDENLIKEYTDINKKAKKYFIDGVKISENKENIVEFLKKLKKIIKKFYSDGNIQLKNIIEKIKSNSIDIAEESSSEDDEAFLENSQDIVKKLQLMKKNLKKPLQKKDKRFIYIDKETGNFKINISIITKAYSKMDEQARTKDNIELFTFFQKHCLQINDTIKETFGIDKDMRILKNEVGSLLNNHIDNLYIKEYNKNLIEIYTRINKKAEKYFKKEVKISENRNKIMKFLQELEIIIKTFNFEKIFHTTKIKKSIKYQSTH